jgi:hypothetical protein
MDVDVINDDDDNNTSSMTSNKGNNPNCNDGEVACALMATISVHRRQR